MPLSRTFTKALIIDAVAEKNGLSRKKSIETIEILQSCQTQGGFQLFADNHSVG